MSTGSDIPLKELHQEIAVFDVIGLSIIKELIRVTSKDLTNYRGE